MKQPFIYHWKRSPVGRTWHWAAANRAVCGVQLPAGLRLFSQDYQPDNDICHNCLRWLGDPRS